MLPEQAIEISKVRFDHAKECLRDAKLLLAGESYRSAANRAYYAIFHAMRAVLALDGVDMKHHSGIISEFRKRYIKTGVFDASLSGLISGASQKPKSGAVRKYPCIFKKVLLFLWLQMPLQAYQSNLVLGLCYA